MKRMKFLAVVALALVICLPGMAGRLPLKRLLKPGQTRLTVQHILLSAINSLTYLGTYAIDIA